MQKKWNIKLDRSRLLIIGGIVALMAIFAILFLLQPDPIVEELTVEAGAESLDPRKFLREDTGETVKFKDLSAVDFAVPGTYPVELEYREETYKSTVVVCDTVPPVAAAKNLAAYSGETLRPEDFIVSMTDVTRVTAAFEKEPDMTKPGSRLVTILLTDLGGNVTEVNAVLTVFHDTTPPELSGVEPQHAYIGTAPDYAASVRVADDYDLNPEIIVDDSKVDMNTLGIYDLVFRAVDAAGNETTVATTITVTDDAAAPVIYGVHEIAVYVGSSVNYTSGVRVVDDKDTAPKLTVDDSAVDLSTPGTYPLFYRAVDLTGNVTEQETTIRIEAKPEGCAAEEDVYAAIDEVLGKITAADMTQEAKVRAVYSWIRSNFTYAGSTLRTDEVQAANELMNEGRGDCFHFFSLGKLMLQRLGVETIDVRKVKNHDGDTDHYWSMVTLDGGESWYHFDATPYPWDPTDFCLVTDGYLDDFSAGHKGYFNRDTSLYPATSEA